MIKKVLYFGNFSIEKGFASVNRSIGIGHLFSMCNYETFIYIKEKNETISNEINSFDEKIFIKQIDSKSKVASYLSFRKYLKIIKAENPNIIVLYDFPFFPFCFICSYCKRKGIKIISDLTEWFDATGYKGIMKLAKKIDTNLRMKFLPKKTDGNIVVSDYLKDYCVSIVESPLIRIYPLMDFVSYQARNKTKTNKANKIIFSYIGNPSGGKDLINDIINSFKTMKNNKCVLHLAGDFNVDNLEGGNVKSFGNLPHNDALNLLLESDFQIILREPKRSNNAGFPSKLAESVVCDTPVIVSNFSDVSKIIDKDEGYIFEYGKVYLPDIINQCVYDMENGIRKKISNKTKRNFEANFYLNDFKSFLESLERKIWKK